MTNCTNYMTVQIQHTDDSISNRFGAFYDLFKGLESYVMSSKSSKWLKASRFYELTGKDLLDTLKLNPESRRAYRISSDLDFCVLLIKDLFNHDSSRTFSICEAIRRIDISQFSIFKDSTTDDVHIYMYFKRQQNVSPFIEQLNDWVNNEEAFDSLDASFIDGPISIPCQDGFAWLNDQGKIIVNRSDITELAAISMFLNEYESKRIDCAEVLEAISQDKNKHSQTDFSVEEQENNSMNSSNEENVVEIRNFAQTASPHNPAKSSTEKASISFEYQNSSYSKLDSNAHQMSIFDVLSNKGRSPP